MFKLGVVAFVMLLIGMSVLSELSDDAAGDFLIFVVAGLCAAALLKVSLDLILHRNKRRVDQQSFNDVLGEQSVKTCVSIEEYRNEVAKRHNRRTSSR